MTCLLRWRGAQANNTNMQMWKSVRKGHHLGIGETFAELTFVEKNVTQSNLLFVHLSWQVLPGARCVLFFCNQTKPRSFAASLLEIPREKSWRQWSGELARGTLEHILFCLSRSLSKRNCLKQIVYSKKMEQHSEEWILLVHIFLLRAKLHTKTYNKNSELIYDIKNLPAAGAYFLKSYVSHS